MTRVKHVSSISISKKTNKPRFRFKAIFLLAGWMVLSVFPLFLSAKPIFLINYPEENEFVRGEDFFLVVSIIDSLHHPIPASIMESRVEIRCDNTPIKEGLEYQDGVLIWRPINPDRMTGVHTLYLSLKDDANQVSGEKSWSLTVLDSKQDDTVKTSPLTHCGRLFADMTQFRLNGKPSMEYSGGGFYRGTFGKWHYATDLYLSSLESRHEQPRNIYQIALGYGKYFDFKAGDISPQMNAFVFSGQRLRGLELSTRLFTSKGINVLSLQAAYGQAKRAVDPRLTLNGDTNWIYGTYKRNLWSVRTAFGYGEHFQLGLFALKGRDDTASIHQAKDSVQAQTGSILQIKGDTPKDNAVIGADISSMMFRQKFELFGLYALSLYTRDISHGAITKEDIKKSIGDIPVDPASLSSFIIFNTSTTPISPYPAGILNSSAYQGGARLRLPFTSLEENAEFRYEMIGVNYYSMGAPLLGVARQGFSISDRVSILQNRVLFNVEMAHYQNSDGTGGEKTQESRYGFQTMIYNGPNWPGFSAGYQLTRAENKDTLYGFDNGVGMLTLSGNYKFTAPAGFKSRAQLFLASTGIQNDWYRVTLDSTSPISSDTSLKMSTLLYSLSLSTEFPQMPLRLTGSFMNNSGNRSFVRLSTWSLLAGYSLMQKKLQLTAGSALQFMKLPPYSESKKQLRFQYGASYSFLEKHSLEFNGAVLSGIAKPDVTHKFYYEFRF